MSKNQQHKQPNSGFINPLEIQSYYQCAYCRTHFLPKKRFVQKYCSESCRVMACRARKNGQHEDNAPHLRGNHTPHPHTAPAAQNPPPPKPQTLTRMDELIKHLEKREKDLQKKLDKIQTQQNYHMVISAIAPFVAEPIRQKLTQLFKEKQQPQDVNHLLQQIEPLIKNLPLELKTQLLQTSVEYWKSNTEQEKPGELSAL